MQNMLKKKHQWSPFNFNGPLFVVSELGGEVIGSHWTKPRLRLSTTLTSRPLARDSLAKPRWDPKFPRKVWLDIFWHEHVGLGSEEFTLNEHLKMLNWWFHPLSRFKSEMVKRSWSTVLIWTTKSSCYLDVENGHIGISVCWTTRLLGGGQWSDETSYFMLLHCYYTWPNGTVELWEELDKLFWMSTCSHVQ